MAYQFNRDWPEIIAEVSTRPEFQTANVTITDPSLVETAGEYDIETGTYPEVINPGIVYVGRARIIGIAGDQSVNGDVAGNATNIVAVRVQLPREDSMEGAYGLGDYGEGVYGTGEGVTFFVPGIRVRTGCVLMVNSAPRQPVLTEYVFTAISDFQGSSSAARTLEFAVALDASPAAVA